MERTGEKVLGIIGICLDGMIVISGLLLWGFVYFSDRLKGPFSFPLLEFLAELILWLSYIALFYAAISLVCLILALFAIKKLKNNPRLSGYLFLIATVVSGSVHIYLIINLYVFFPIQSFVYLIAGILCLLGRSKTESVINDEG